MDTELLLFKTEIDLRQYAAAQGYQLDRRDSWRGSTVMRRGCDKVVIKRNANGHYIYFSVRDDADNGTIIDFVQNRGARSLGEVRLALREWIGMAAGSTPEFPKLEPTSKDRLRVEAEYQRMHETIEHPYLLGRAIPAGVLSSARFAGRVRGDDRGSAVFPHFDQEGLCGYEVKNHGFTGFATGGEKGLWVSRAYKRDGRLVLAESAIDALSHAVLFPDVEDRTRYASIAGTPNPKQPRLIEAALARLGPGAIVVAAFDADAAGRGLAKLVGSLAGETMTFRVHLPARDGDDWNKVLQDRRRRLFPIAPGVA